MFPEILRLPRSLSDWWTMERKYMVSDGSGASTSSLDVSGVVGHLNLMETRENKPWTREFVA